MVIYVIPNASKTHTPPVFANACKILYDDGVHIIADEALRQQYGALPYIDWVPNQSGYAKADMVLTIGGDGTMLHAARQCMPFDIPMAGINTGRLGFLTIMEKNELEKLHRLSRGEYVVDTRSMLRVDAGGTTQYALNDIVLFKQNPENTISLNIYCDDILVSSFLGDGVIFATPTGSTAYSMSAGGPIVDARLNAVVVTQICAHIIHTPPLVFDATRMLRAEKSADSTGKVFLSCDGLPSCLALEDAPVVITKADYSFYLVQFHDSGQVKAIDEKLKGR